MLINKFFQPIKFALLFFIVNQANASDWPEMPFTEKSKVVIVSESMVFNGVPMKTWTITSNESLEYMTSFYRREWKTIEGTLFDEQVIDGWTYINSKQDNGFILTVKLNSNLGVTKGFMGISNPQRRLKNYQRGKNFPVPGSSLLINDITEKDASKNQRFLLLTTGQDVTSTYDFYLKAFTEKGWLTQATNIHPEQEGAFIAMNKDGDELNVSISKLGTESQVMASFVERTLF